jgi:hypothetical protein
MSREDNRSSNRSAALKAIAELEERRNILLLQQREVAQMMQNYSNQAFELSARIDEVTATITRLMEEVQQMNEEEAEIRRRNREELLRKRRELEEGRAKAKQWYEDRERRRRSG